MSGIGGQLQAIGCLELATTTVQHRLGVAAVSYTHLTLPTSDLV